MPRRRRRARTHPSGNNNSNTIPPPRYLLALHQRLIDAIWQTHHENEEAAIATIERLILQNRRVLETGDEHGWTPLLFACNCQPPLHLAVMELLVRYAPHTVTLPDSDGYYPLHVACNVPDQSLETIQLLVQQGPTVVSITDQEGDTPLHLACEHDTTLAVVDYLVQHFPMACLYRNDFGRLPWQEAERQEQRTSEQNQELIRSGQALHFLHRLRDGWSAQQPQDVHSMEQDLESYLRRQSRVVTECMSQVTSEWTRALVELAFHPKCQVPQSVRDHIAATLRSVAESRTGNAQPPDRAATSGGAGAYVEHESNSATIAATTAVTSSWSSHFMLQKADHNDLSTVRTILDHDDVQALVKDARYHVLLDGLVKMKRVDIQTVICQQASLPSSSSSSSSSWWDTIVPCIGNNLDCLFLVLLETNASAWWSTQTTTSTMTITTSRCQTDDEECPLDKAGTIRSAAAVTAIATDTAGAGAGATTEEAATMASTRAADRAPSSSSDPAWASWLISSSAPTAAHQDKKRQQAPDDEQQHCELDDDEGMGIKKKHKVEEVAI